MIRTTFREILRRAGQRIQNLDTSTSNDNDLYPKLKVWSNERYKRLLRSKPWPQLNKIERSVLQIVASQDANFSFFLSLDNRQKAFANASWAASSAKCLSPSTECAIATIAG